MDDSLKTVKELIARDQNEFHICYKGHLANHQTMSLLALKSMGADSQRLRDFFNKYSEHLEKRRDLTDVLITSGNWKEHLGKHLYFREYREFFKRELHLGNFQNYHFLVKHYFPLLMEGMIGGAFHPLILMGFGIEFDMENVVIDSLAFMCFAYNSLGTVNYPDFQVVSNVPSPIEIFKKINSQFSIKHSDFASENFLEKLNILKQKYANLFDTYDLLEVNLNKIDEVYRKIFATMLGLYSSTHDFFVLHGLTSCHALGQVLPILKPEDKVVALRYYMRALIAVYIVQGQPPLETVDVDAFEHIISLLSWDSILQKAILCDDVHTIKLVFAVWRESQNYYMDPEAKRLCLLIAAEKVGALDTKFHYTNFSSSNLWWMLASGGILLAGLGVGLATYLKVHK